MKHVIGVLAFALLFAFGAGAAFTTAPDLMHHPSYLADDDTKDKDKDKDKKPSGPRMADENNSKPRSR